MSKIKVAINGFGRIGRVTLRALLKNSNIEVVAINDITDSATLAHLFKYDSIHGKFDVTVVVENEGIRINGTLTIQITAQRDPASLFRGKSTWRVDTVIESTGLFY